MVSVKDLHQLIQTCPIVDHHCHPLLSRTSQLGEELRTELLKITSEASGSSLLDSKHTLAHHRSVAILSSILGCEHSWEAVSAELVKKRGDEKVWHTWNARCFEGIETLLLDDGLGVGDAQEEQKILSYSSHDRYVKRSCKRIVRVEIVAETLLKNGMGASHFVDEFREEMKRYIADEEVMGFKSIACYRTGLNVTPMEPQDTATRISTLQNVVSSLQASYKSTGVLRLDGEQNKPLIDALLNFLCQLLTVEKSSKPIQFHTGLGDTDLTLTLASPAHLQPLIRNYPSVNFVLLHSGWPFHREAAYLTMYKNVALDVGEIFPFLSKGGQKAVLKEVLELASWAQGKLMWSTDGHWFPETYLVAVVEMREVLEEVLLQMIGTGDGLKVQDALGLVKGLLFENANKLYRLGYEFESSPFVTSPGEHSTTQKLKGTEKIIFERFITFHPNIKYIRLQWLDYTSTLRCRVLPIARVRSILSRAQPNDPFPMGDSIRIIKSLFGLTQNDHMAAGHWFTPTLEVAFVPYWDTLNSCEPWLEHATVMGGFVDVEQITGEILGEVQGDPMTLLLRAEAELERMGLEMAFGAEIEVVFLDAETREPLKGTYAYGTSRGTSGKGLQICEEVFSALEENTDIDVAHFHKESAPGQFEIVLNHTYSLRKAFADLVHTKETIFHIAQRKGVLATWHPKPFSMTAGTGAHLHMSCRTSSLKQNSLSKDQIEEHFIAGILDHIPALLSFTLPHPMSWARVSPDFSAWSGSAGGYVSWGVNNKETSIRKCSGECHYEFRLLDGMAHPGLAIAGIVWSAIDGLKSRRRLLIKASDPATFTPEQIKEHNLTVKIPTSVEEALERLQADVELIKTMDGQAIVEDFVALKRHELKYWSTMNEAEQSAWIFGKY
ncbi:glutamine synthetase/guanido kinase [Atractiella rhizophila]|nr:glutamine synthetase/guanido kinase [Atractiella rhizophila]